MYVYSCIGYKFLTWSLVFISSKYVMKFSIFERTAMQHDMQTQRTHIVTLLELKVVTNKCPSFPQLRHWFDTKTWHEL